MSNKINKTLIPILLISMILAVSGCSGIKIFGKKSNMESVSKAKIENVEYLLSSNLQSRMDEVANLSYGVGYALNQETNPSTTVDIAKELNTRISSLSGVPTIDEINKMKEMVDNLNSQLTNAVLNGKKALAKKDKDIYALQLKTKVLNNAKDKEIAKYMEQAKNTALQADTIQSKLDDMNSMMGLGAIWYGIKRLILHASWILGIGSILYLVLRFASISNPIAASVFGIFNIIGSWFVNLIKILTPKALEVAGHTSTIIANQYKSVMTKMIDNIEYLKQIQKKDPTKKYTIDELLIELSKSMNSNEKEIISQTKTDIGYIK